MWLARLIDVYSLVIFAAVVLSWFRLPPESPLVRIVSALTEPVLRPLRRVVPNVAGLDLSPMVVLLGLQLLRRLLTG
ncbi:MAG: YggT family protein [Myxococcales bacterium]|nr:YggT family protein [Myxococcales bacterium]